MAKKKSDGGDGQSQKPDARSKKKGDGDGGDGDGGDSSSRKQTLQSPAGDIITTELLDSGDVRVEGSKRGVQDFISNIQWSESYGLQVDEAGVTLLLKRDREA